LVKYATFRKQFTLPVGQQMGTPIDTPWGIIGFACSLGVQKSLFDFET